jgi:hypothetical protein
VNNQEIFFAFSSSLLTPYSLLFLPFNSSENHILPDIVPVAFDDFEHTAEDVVREVVGGDADVDEALVSWVVVVLFCLLPGVFQVVDLDLVASL